MSDYGKQLSARLYYDSFYANTTAPSIAVNVSITTGQTAATLASVPAGLVKSGQYNIAATGIPAGTTFRHPGNSVNITLSQAATATNGAAASTISMVQPP